MKVGFIGLGNVGGKLAGSLARAGVDLRVLDLDPARVTPMVEAGAEAAVDVAALAWDRDVVITCLPTPAASAAVVEGPGGLAQHLPVGSTWAEMSTTDAREVVRLGELLAARGVATIDCPVSGGCHRAASGNIAILAGGDRATFERMLPLLTAMGRDVLHTGPLGSASELKVVTNYLATANLVALCEALATCAAAELDLATAWEAIRISSGNSFVHETEGQVILNGSRDISFTMDLVDKDVGLFQQLAERVQVPVELSPLLVSIVRDGLARYGPREGSPNLVRRLEDATGLQILAEGFPSQMVDDTEPTTGREVVRTPSARQA